MQRFVCAFVLIVEATFNEGYSMVESVINAGNLAPAMFEVQKDFVSNSSRFQKALDIIRSSDEDKKKGAEAMVNEALDGNMFAIEFLYNSFGISDLEKEISKNGKDFVIEEVMFSF